MERKCVDYNSLLTSYYATLMKLDAEGSRSYELMQCLDSQQNSPGKHILILIYLKGKSLVRASLQGDHEICHLKIEF